VERDELVEDLLSFRKPILHWAMLAYGTGEASDLAGIGDFHFDETLRGFVFLVE